MFHPDQKIAIVGNGGSALEYKAGSFIDSCDEVVRFNNYEIKGFEEFVGTKTTIWAFNSNMHAIKHRDYREFKRVLLNVSNIRFMSKDEWREDVTALYPNLEVINSNITKKFLKMAGYEGTKRLSAGVAAICVLVLEYSNIYIHGFDFFGEKYGDRSKSKHYFNGATVPTQCHVPAKEKKIIDMLIEKGKLKIIGA